MLCNILMNIRKYNVYYYVKKKYFNFQTYNLERTKRHIYESKPKKKNNARCIAKKLQDTLI